MSATQKQIEAILAKLEPPVTKAFLEAIAQSKRRVSIKKLEAAIQRGDIDAMMKAAGLTSGNFSNLQETIRTTYRTVGDFTIEADVPARIGFTFDMYNPRVQEWLSQRASYLVRDIHQTQIAAIQDVIQAGYRAGRNPRSVALDIVGRIDATGRRRGGVIGLHQPFAKAATTARAELTELNPAYFQRMRRDRRFDYIIQRAIDAKTPLTEDVINQIVNSYESRLLQLRGETIARTEVKMVFEAAADESLMQIVDEGLVEADAIEKIWSATGDARTRPSHMAANGQRVKLNERFNVAGYRMLYPGDPSAPASETINCFLPDTPVAVLGLKGAIRSHYSGNIVKLRSSAGVELAVTANHPILTNRGWVAADELMKGDKLINHKIRNNFASPHPDVENRVSAAEELYSSLEFLGRTGRVSGSSVNLHGYQPTQEVDVVSLDPSLRNNFDSPLAQFFSQFTLAETDVNSGLFMFSRIAGQSNTGHPCASDGVMSCCCSGAPLIGRIECCTSTVPLANTGRGYANVSEARIDKCSGYANFFSNAVNRVSVIEKSFNALRILCALLFSRDGQSARRRSINSISGERLNAKVKKAAAYDSGCYTKILSYLGDRLICSLSNGIVKALSVFEMPRYRMHPIRNVPAAIDKSGSDLANAKPGLVSNLAESFPSCIEGLEISEVTGIEIAHYEGPVFNFETESGLILASAIITHNCRCIVTHSVDFSRVRV